MIASLLARFVQTPGRGHGTYFTRKMFALDRLKCDCYLIFYPEGGGVEPHYDPSPVDGYGHHRVNITIVKPKRGGTFKYRLSDDPFMRGIIFVPNNQRFIRFRPDLHEHWIVPVAEGYRLVLSFGWLRRIR